MSIIIVVILHKFLVLDVSIFLLDGIELVSEGDIVFVTLLDLEDLRLQLTDKKVLLVACKMHGIVILQEI